MVETPDCDEFMPKAIRDNLGNTGLAVTKDFYTYRRLGRITSPILDDRDVIIFPEKSMGNMRFCIDLNNISGVNMELTILQYG